jgi:hypothetical protein
MDGFGAALRGWQNFYFMAGGAAASLLGLMFVAMSLATRLINERTREDMQTFVAPSVFYFVSAVLLSAVMLVPADSPALPALALLLGGAGGLARTLLFVRRLVRAARQHQDFTWEDWLAQITLPIASYGLILLSALGLAAGQASPAFIGLWLAMIVLLICGIANTWSLVTWIVERWE